MITTLFTIINTIAIAWLWFKLQGHDVYITTNGNRLNDLGKKHNATVDRMVRKDLANGVTQGGIDVGALKAMRELSWDANYYDTRK